MQGEDARCFAPWAGHDPTPHEPWPAPHAESRAEEFAAPPVRWRRTWRYGADRERNGGPLTEPRSRSMNSGRQTSEAFGSGFGRGRLGQPEGKPTACARSACRAGTRSRDPAHQGRLNPPKVFQAPPRCSQEPESGCPPRSSRRSPANPDRSAAPAQGESGVLRRRIRRCAGRPNSSSRQRNQAGAASRHRRRATIPVRGPQLPGSPFAAWTSSADPVARRPLNGESLTLTDDPALSRGKQAWRRARNRTSRNFVLF